MNLKYPCISTHQSLHGEITVDWRRDYDASLQCPQGCNNRDLWFYWSSTKQEVQIQCCCGAKSSLMCRNRVECISVHKTLHGTLTINWKRDYDNSFQCPAACGSRALYVHRNLSGNTAKFTCKCCNSTASVTQPVEKYIYNYRKSLNCPNPNCTNSWVYLYAINKGQEHFCCHNCKTIFGTSKAPWSWTGRHLQQVTPFDFNEDIWDLRNFYDSLRDHSLNFEIITPTWYKTLVKQYLYQKLKAKTHKSSTLQMNLVPLKLLGLVIEQQRLCQVQDISRATLLAFLISRRGKSPRTISNYLYSLADCFDWLGLNTPQLIRRRDYPKLRESQVEWLEKKVCQAICLHLHKIPDAIARQYQIQKHIAARLGDACQLFFHCLVEDSGKWYIQFSQSKVLREHRVPATREIRRVIEQQQQWIRETLGPDYPYLFCHFWGVRKAHYPNFPKMQPLPEPPLPRTNNQMVRIINMMIEREDLKDSNGQRPHFSGSITRHSRLQEVREKHGIEVAAAYADHQTSSTTFQHYTQPTREEVAQVDLPFQKLLLNLENRFLPWQSVPESLLKNPAAHELDIEVSSRLTVYGYCALDPEQLCPKNLYPKCYGCTSFSTLR